jgi:hypothetical protein
MRLNSVTASAPRPNELRYLRALCRQIQLGNCVLTLGPGANTDLLAGKEVPLSVTLARELASDERVSGTKDLDRDDLRHVSQIIYELDRSLTMLQDRVIEYYAGFQLKTTAFHRNIAALPFRLCITSTPDDFLYNALRDANKSPTRQFYNFRRPRPIQLPEPTVDRPLVYHLYGYPDEPDSLVITENDLVDFLVSVVRNEPPVPPRILAQLGRLETTCLFVDLGFKNWYLRILLRVLQLYGHQEMSIALEAPEFFAQSHQHQTTVYFTASKTIQFRQDSLNEFATNLRATYDSLAQTRQEAVGTLPTDAPRVFLSYASEDRELVEQLAERLQAAGIAIWQDKQSLRAGDNWYRVLVQVLNKQVDAVVVVQTSAMVRRLEGYFYMEIAEALKRQERIKEGVRFVFPVSAGNVESLPMLEHLHCVRVDTDEGVNTLVRSILEDWQQRGQSRE